MISSIKMDLIGETYINLSLRMKYSGHKHKESWAVNMINVLTWE